MERYNIIMPEPDLVASWGAALLSFPRVILGFLLGYAAAIYTLHKGWISIPSVSKKITMLEKQNAVLLLSAEDAETWAEYKDKLAQESLKQLFADKTDKIGSKSKVKSKENETTKI